MKVGIMQPYFFPYLGYFSLIQKVDKFILLDEVQYIRHGWIERNRISSPNGGWFYFRVPLQKLNQKTFIKDVKIKENELWREKIIAQMKGYKNRAPNFKKVESLVREIIYEKEFFDIVTLNYRIIKQICLFLEIKTEIEIFSSMNLAIDKPAESGDWALNICKSMEADCYLNPENGRCLFNEEEFKKVGIRLLFLKNVLNEYVEHGDSSLNLSIIDILMFYSEEETKEMLNYFREVN